MEVKDHRGLVKLRSGDGAGSPEGGHTRDSSHQERQEFVPAQGNRAQVEQVRAFSAAVTPSGKEGERRPRRERMLPSPWRSSEIFLHLTPPLPKRDNPPREGKDEIYPSAQQSRHGLRQTPRFLKTLRIRLIMERGRVHHRPPTEDGPRRGFRRFPRQREV